MWRIWPWAIPAEQNNNFSELFIYMFHVQYGFHNCCFDVDAVINTYIILTLYSSYTTI